jgi:hypothetical protein
MISTQELRRWHIDQDLSDIARDVLEFNYNSLAEDCLRTLEIQDDQHQRETKRLEEEAGVGRHVAILLKNAQKAGKKTIRIEDVFQQAYDRFHAEIREGQ